MSAPDPDGGTADRTGAPDRPGAADRTSTVSDPDGATSDPARAGRPRYPPRPMSLALALAGAGLVLLAATRTWATVSFAVDLPGLDRVPVTGREAAPAAVPVSLAGVAAAVVLAVSGRRVRMLVGAGLVLAGAALGIGAARTAGDRPGLEAIALREALGLVGDRSTAPGADAFAGASVAVSPWVWLAVAGSALLVAAGLVVLVRRHSWPAPTPRYDRPGSTAATPGGSAAATGGAGATGSGGAGATGSGGAGATGPAGATGTWDALSRGEDPTAGD